MSSTPSLKSWLYAESCSGAAALPHFIMNKINWDYPENPFSIEEQRFYCNRFFQLCKEGKTIEEAEEVFLDHKCDSEIEKIENLGYCNYTENPSLNKYNALDWKSSFVEDTNSDVGRGSGYVSTQIHFPHDVMGDINTSIGPTFNWFDNMKVRATFQKHGRDATLALIRSRIDVRKYLEDTSNDLPDLDNPFHTERSGSGKPLFLSLEIGDEYFEGLDLYHGQ
ncbi:hypothetical protein BDQ12DRAFT_670035 [Crucibulum laeve]|uniref:Uncharacterized protein n=1 Tax=Crucibulum laeve TaxID=68775 RepID=A0A5C3LLX1_9AGAR|nr:hypothetical protein BDQ12DRAFT_670035 [Crucibulum laeve]